MVNMEFSDEVQRQLSELNENDRAVLILRYWYECSEIEICEALNITKSAVKSRLHRARKHMAEQWSQANGDLIMEGRNHEAQTI